MSNVVAVKFDSYGGSYTGKDYHYLTDLDLKVGDLVVVGCPTGSLEVVKVQKLLGPLEGSRATKWIIDKVDLDAHKEREERERRKTVLKTKLKQIEKQVEETAKYQYLAAFSPEAAKLIKELEELN